MRKLLLVFFLFSFVVLKAQVSAGSNQTICIGESTQLNGSGPASYTYEWTSSPNDPSISDPTSLTPDISPILTTTYTYTLTGRSVSPSNLVTNGDFENGNTSFTSSYLYSPGPNGLWNEGTYAVTDDASYNHNNFTCSNDHTPGAGVMFMAVNGAQTANVEVWSQTISNVTPNTEYEFSTWVASLSPQSPAILQFRINGVLMGEPFTASNISCQWNKFFEKWNSGSATSADISIINQNTAGGGNDFSLDDINFSLVTYYDDACQVVVAPIPTSSFSMTNQSCSSDTTSVTYDGTPSPTATYNWDFGAATTISGTGSGPYQLQWPTSGLHAVSLSVEDICSSDTTTRNINIQQSPTANLTADATTIPFGTTTFLHGAMSGNPGPLSFLWDPQDKLLQTDILDPETELLQQNTLFTFLVTDDFTQCVTPDTITIKVSGGPLFVGGLQANPDTICFGLSTELTLNIQGGSGNYTATWTSDPPATYTETATSIQVSPTITTTYFAEVSDGFTTEPLVSVEVVVLPQIEVINQPHDTTIEVGESAMYHVEAIYNDNYQWQLSMDQGQNWQNLSDDATYSGSQTNTLTVSGASANMNGFLYRCLLTGKCDPANGSAAVLTVIDAPTFIADLDSIIACQGDTVYVPCSIENFSDIQSYHLRFSYDPIALEFLGLENIHNDLLQASWYHEGDSIIFYEDAPAPITIGTGLIFNFKFLVLEGLQTSIQWRPDTYVQNSYGFFPPLLVTEGSISSTALAIAPDSVMSSKDSLNILDEVDIELSATGGFGDDLIWTTDSCDGTEIGDGNPLTIFRPEQTTTYFAKWTNPCGDSECKQVLVKITEQFVFKVATAFTPNGDGLNDDFGVMSPSTLPFFEFKIYNRWGQMVFSTQDQYETWDGSFGGQPAPQGTYVWKASYQYRDNGPGSELHQETGMVTLIF